MTPDEYKSLYELEEHHWWFVGMRRIVAAIMDRFVSVPPARIFDAGCGTGFTMSWLRRYGQASKIIGLDVSSDALDYCRRRGENLLIRGSVVNLPLASESFDLVVCLDVLVQCKLEDAAQSIGELSRLLAKGGLILIRVAAYQCLYSMHDRALGTHHRYRAPELAEFLKKQGLQLEYVTYANTLLFPAAVVWRWFQRFRPQCEQSDVRRLPRAIRWLNSVLAWPLALEAAWVRYSGWRLPFGLSVIALARKRADCD